MTIREMLNWIDSFITEPEFEILEGTALGVQLTICERELQSNDLRIFKQGTARLEEVYQAFKEKNLQGGMEAIKLFRSELSKKLGL